MSLSNPFAAFIMSEFHAPETDAIVRSEERAAIPGQVECPAPHPIFEDGSNEGWHGVIDDGAPCLVCGAAV